MEGVGDEIGLGVVWKVDFCTIFTEMLTRFYTGALRFERFLQRIVDVLQGLFCFVIPLSQNESKRRKRKQFKL